MCFSENVSLFAFIIGIWGSMMVYSLGKIYDKILGLFLAFVSSMQLIEFFLWRNQTCDDYNYFITMTGMILNHLQPIVLGLLILWLNPTLSTQDTNTIFCILFVYLCVFLPYSWQFMYDPQCTLKNKNNHLDWKWNMKSYYFLAYSVFILALFMLFYWFVPVYGLLFAIMSFISFATSVFIYNKEIGNMWCFYAVFFPILYYLFRIRVRP